MFHSKYICVLEPRIIFASNVCNVHIAAMAIIADIVINTLMNISAVDSAKYSKFGCQNTLIAQILQNHCPVE